MEDLKISDEEPAQPVYGGGPLPNALHVRQSCSLRRGAAGVNQAVGELAENKLIDREFGVLQCSLGGPTRSTFLMVSDGFDAWRSQHLCDCREVRGLCTDTERTPEVGCLQNREMKMG